MLVNKFNKKDTANPFIFYRSNFDYPSWPKRVATIEVSEFCANCFYLFISFIN